MARFRTALKQGEKFSTGRFDFCGYDGTLWCEPRENGDMAAGFSKEYRNCGNGYYYLLINDEYMIGYDILSYMQDRIGQSLGTVCCSDRPTAFYKIPFSLI